MTFEEWWDSNKSIATPDTYKGWEESCRQAWAAGAANSVDAKRYGIARRWGVRTLVEKWGGDRYCTKTMERADAAIDETLERPNN